MEEFTLFELQAMEKGLKAAIRLIDDSGINTIKIRGQAAGMESARSKILSEIAARLILKAGA